MGRKLARRIILTLQVKNGALSNNIVLFFNDFVIIYYIRINVFKNTNFLFQVCSYESKEAKKKGKLMAFLVRKYKYQV